MKEGRLLIVGGNENKRGKNSLLRDFVQLSGGKEGKIAVVPTATKEQKEKGEMYREVFFEHGALEVQVLKVEDRKDANKRYLEDFFADITGVFFTGGDQLRLTSIIGGTFLNEILVRRYAEGLLLGGTSAGASFMSDTMIVEGKEETAPARGIVAMAPGLGFWQQSIIDQHFDQRGRIGRLLAAVAQNPGVIGLGIDEDTAVITEKGSFKVLGTQTVTVVDGSNINISDVSQENRKMPLSLSNITLHVLSRGYGFDMISRKVKKEEVEID